MNTRTKHIRKIAQPPSASKPKRRRHTCRQPNSAIVYCNPSSRAVNAQLQLVHSIRRRRTLAVQLMLSSMANTSAVLSTYGNALLPSEANSVCPVPAIVQLPSIEADFLYDVLSSSHLVSIGNDEQTKRLVFISHTQQHPYKTPSIGPYIQGRNNYSIPHRRA